MVNEMGFFRERNDIETSNQNPKVYVAGPYSSAPEKNTKRAIEITDSIRELGFDVFCPHLYHFWEKQDNEHDYEYWLNSCKKWLFECDVMVRFSGDSPGAEQERELAHKLDIPVVEYEDFEDTVKQTRTIFCLIGPSGIGKTTALRILENNFGKGGVIKTFSDNFVKQVPSFTSRKPRSDKELENSEYRFVDDKTILEMKENDQLVESIEYDGNYYGFGRQIFEDLMVRGINPFCIVTQDGYEQISDEFGCKVFPIYVGTLDDEHSEKFKQNNIERKGEERGKKFVQENKNVKDVCNLEGGNLVKSENYPEILFHSSKDGTLFIKNLFGEQKEFSNKIFHAIDHVLSKEGKLSKKLSTKWLDKDLVFEDMEYSIKYHSDITKNRYNPNE